MVKYVAKKPGAVKKPLKVKGSTKVIPGKKIVHNDKEPVSKEAQASVAESMQVVMIPIGEIETNDYNPNAMEKEQFELLVAHIQEDGVMVQPVLVRLNPNPDGLKYMVVDGEHRFKASKSAGLKEIMAIVVPYDEDTAMIRTISMNQLRGNYIPIRMAKLIADLQERHSIQDLQRMTGIKEEEFKSLSQLLEVPDIDFGDGPTISTASVERPIAVNIMLMPDEHSDYKKAMVKAMELGGPLVVPLIADEVGSYDKAMTIAFGISGTRLRNVGLATICRVFNALTPEDQQLLVEEVTGKNDS